jgi:hypothetical protein
MAERKPRKKRAKPIKRGPKGGRKHTPGKGHNTKSGAPRQKRFAKKKQRERDEERERCREQWAQWDALPEDVKKLRPDHEPDCPRPTDESNTHEGG